MFTLLLSGRSISPGTSRTNRVVPPTDWSGGFAGSI